MKKFVTNIKKKFKSSRDKQWPPCHSKKEVRLKLLVREKRVFHQQGGQEGSIVKESPLPYRDLFKVEVESCGKKPVRKVLVEGDGGIGKTTFCTSICKDWASGKLFQQFELILYIPLHHKKLVSASSLPELLKLLYSSEKEKMCASVASYLVEEKGKNVLVIADGWDQLDEIEQKNGSFLNRMLFGPNYPFLSVVLTSRPSSSTQLHRLPCIDRFIKVCGFNKDEIKEYFLSELGSDKKTAGHLLEQLERNTLVEVVCSVPFNCAIICHLWRTLEEDIPTTMTELYTKMTLHIVFGNVQRKKSALSAYNFNAIPKELQRSWWFLCEFAFQAIIKDQSIFSREELSSFLPQNKDIFCFGLLQSVESFAITDSFHFLHPTFQMYLAALHLVKQPPDVQLTVFRQHARAKHFDTVWRFFFGVYFVEVEFEDIDIIKQAIQILCRSSSDRPLQACHYAFEARREEVNSEFVKVITYNESIPSSGFTHLGNPHTAHDCAAVVHVLSNVQECSNIEINFRNCSLREKQVSELGYALASKLGKVQVKALDLSNNKLADKVVLDLFHKASSAFRMLEKLFLRDNLIGAGGTNAIVVALAKSPTVTQLDLSLNPLTIRGLLALQDAVLSGTLANLEILFLQESLTHDSDTNIGFLSTFAEALRVKCPSLRRIDLFANNLGKSGTPAICEIISHLTGIRKDFDLRLNREYMAEVDNSFIATMEESIRQRGTIDHTIAHGVIVGPGRSGKNSLMNRLMGEGPLDPDTVSPSTGVLESIVKVEVKKLCTVAAAVSNLNWKRLDYDEEALELIMTTAKSHSTTDYITASIIDDYQQEPTTDVIFDNTDATVTPDTGQTQNAAKKTREESVLTVPMKSKSEQISSNEMSMARHSPYSDHDTDSYQRPLDIFKRAVELRRMDALREHLESSWSLYLTNTGGQMEFQELLPLLVCGPSVFFITFPLNKDLNKHYTVRYQHTDSSEETYLSPSTLMDEILQTLATIATLDTTGPQHNVKLKPKVFFVGTHKDKLPQSITEESIQEIDQQLQEKIKLTSLFRQDSIEFALPPRQLMFTVNNLAKDDEDFQKIRSALQKCVELTREFTIKCPSTWLIFSLILRAKHKSSQVLSYNECFTIAQGCGISDRTELNHALFFIHTRLGLVRYFSVKELNTLVVIDPQILFDNITKLIVETFVSGHAKVTEIEEFQKRGIFSMDVMKRISNKDHSDLAIPFDWMLKLLNYLRIAAFFSDHNGEEKCFFPSVLCHAPEQLSKLSYCSFSPPSMLIAFESGFCPRGIPGALIKYLMTNEMKSEIFWDLHTNRIFKNQVSFSVGPGDVTFKILPTHLEVCFDRESGTTDLSEVEETCGETYKQIKQAMKMVTKGYRNSGCGYFFAFHCTRPECQNNPHPAEIEWHKKKLRCRVINRRSDLPDLHRVWKGPKKTRAFQKGEFNTQYIHVHVYLINCPMICRGVS